MRFPTDRILGTRSLGGLAALAATAFALRGWLFGNPVLHIDEQFYLLVGTRMWDGAIPFVDIWDRKPPGLFALYALLAPLGGVWGYQVAATVAATATAWLVLRIALRVADAQGALAAGLATIGFTLLFNGGGGQTPVFYGPLVCGAALLTLRLATAPTLAGFDRGAVAAMALMGLAIQLKYTVVFEGAYFGLALIWRLQKAGVARPAIALRAAGWIVVALVPTLLAVGIYAWLGQLGAFVEANFLSVLSRAEPGWLTALRFLQAVVLLLPFWLCLFHAPRRHVMMTAMLPGSRAFLSGWAVAAVGGFLLFGGFYDHYVIPLVPPLAVLAAPMLGRPKGQGRWYTILTLTVALGGGLGATLERFRERGTAAEIDAVAAAIRPHVGPGRCLHVYEGDPVLYRLTGACTTTRYLFPSHLNNAKEINAIGVDTSEEMHRVLGARTAVIVMDRGPRVVANPINRALVGEALARDYRRVAALPVGTHAAWVYARRDLMPAAARGTR